jgi:hypothetical protein
MYKCDIIEDMKIQIQQGDRYGRLTIIQEIEGKSYLGIRCGRNIKRYVRRFECKCDCGNVTSVFLQDLRSNKTRSCGCLNLENSLKKLEGLSEKNITHGMSKTKEYRAWSHMVGRCMNEDDQSYHYYGGRGIKVCDKWLRFEGFWEDMKEGYSDQLTIDRIDNNGNYEKNNCRWVSMEEQSKNKRNNKSVTYNGETLIVADWSKRLGGNRSLVSSRINILGWNIEKAITTPRQIKHNNT